MVKARYKGNFRRLEGFLTRDYEEGSKRKLEKIGLEGLEKLKEATPVRTGLTRDSWDVKVEKADKGYTVVWFNTNTDADGIPVVVYLEYGHGRRGGGYVPARYFIRDTLKPFYAQIANRLGLGPEVNKIG